MTMMYIDKEKLLSSPPLSDRKYFNARHHAVTLCVYLPSHARRICLGGEGNALYSVPSIRRRLASGEGIVTLAVTLCVCPCVCPPRCVQRVIC